MPNNSLCLEPVLSDHFEKLSYKIVKPTSGSIFHKKWLAVVEQNTNILEMTELFVLASFDFDERCLSLENI